MHSIQVSITYAACPSASFCYTVTLDFDRVLPVAVASDSNTLTRPHVALRVLRVDTLSINKRYEVRSALTLTRPIP